MIQLGFPKLEVSWRWLRALFLYRGRLLRFPYICLISKRSWAGSQQTLLSISFRGLFLAADVQSAWKISPGAVPASGRAGVALRAGAQLARASERSSLGSLVSGDGRRDGRRGKWRCGCFFFRVTQSGHPNTLSSLPGFPQLTSGYPNSSLPGLPPQLIAP